MLAAVRSGRPASTRPSNLPEILGTREKGLPVETQADIDDASQPVGGARFLRPWRRGESLADARMEPLGLTDQEKEDLLAFLESLTGEVPEWAGRAPRLPPAEIRG